MMLLRRAVLFSLLAVNLVLMMHLSLEYKMATERARLLSERSSIHGEYQGILFQYCGNESRLKDSYGRALAAVLKDLGLQRRSCYASAFVKEYSGIGGGAL